MYVCVCVCVCVVCVIVWDANLVRFRVVYERIMGLMHGFGFKSGLGVKSALNLEYIKRKYLRL